MPKNSVPRDKEIGEIKDMLGGSPNPCVKKFVFSYQQMIRAGYKVYLLMSGLYENGSELEREKSLTILLRAPKIGLEPFDLHEIVYFYLDALPLGEGFSIKASYPLTPGVKSSSLCFASRNSCASKKRFFAKYSRLF